MQMGVCREKATQQNQRPKSGLFNPISHKRKMYKMERSLYFNLESVLHSKREGAAVCNQSSMRENDDALLKFNKL